GGEPLDALGRPEGADFEAQLPPGFFFGGALPVQLFDLVPVAQQLEVLPRRKQQQQHEESRHAERFPQLALPRLVDFAHDRVVADVLPDGVLERLHMSPRNGLETVPYTMTRRRALERLALAGSAGLQSCLAREACRSKDLRYTSLKIALDTVTRDHRRSGSRFRPVR